MMYGRKEVEELAEELNEVGYHSICKDLFKLKAMSAQNIFTLTRVLIASKEDLVYNADLSNASLRKLNRFISWAEHGFEERGAGDEENFSK